MASRTLYDALTMQGTLSQIAQNSPNIWTWFYTNAPAAWISAVAAMAMLLFVLRSRKRPNGLIVREMANDSLINIREGVRNLVKVTYLDKPIMALGWVSHEIINDGSELINEPTFNMTLPNNTSVIDAFLNPLDPDSKITTEGNVVTVRLPYLNPYRDHKEERLRS